MEFNFDDIQAFFENLIATIEKLIASLENIFGKFSFEMKGYPTEETTTAAEEENLPL